MAGLTPEPSRMVKPPRVKESPVALECRYWRTIELPAEKGHEALRGSVVFGQVVGVHIDDAVLTGGLVDLKKIRPIARLGYMDYAVVDTIFSMQRPPGGG